MSILEREDDRGLAASRAPDLRRVLVISHVGDDRHKHGGAVYTRSLLELLRAGYPGVHVDLIFFTGEVSAIVRAARQAKALIRAAFSRLPSKALYFQSRSFASRLAAKMASGGYDLVVFDHAEMLWCLDVVPASLPTLAVAHNIESSIYEQFLSRRPIARRLLGNDQRKYARFEIEGLARARNVVAISSDDADELRAAIPGLNALVVPPTFSYATVERAAERHRPLRLGLLGNFGWWANRDAYDWFVREVWPRVTSGVELHVFGPHSPTLQPAPRTTLHGFVKDLADLWRGIDLMVNPIVSGSGVNVKVAEAIYNGMPMICTPRAMAGLLSAPDPAIAVLEEADEWVRVLQGDEALALARVQPLPATRAHVASATHVGPLRSFVAGAIASARRP